MTLSNSLLYPVFHFLVFLALLLRLTRPIILLTQIEAIEKKPSLMRYLAALKVHIIKAPETIIVILLLFYYLRNLLLYPEYIGTIDNTLFIDIMLSVFFFMQALPNKKRRRTDRVKLPIDAAE